jgi:hypothetical protein
MLVTINELVQKTQNFFLKFSLENNINPLQIKITPSLKFYLINIHEINICILYYFTKNIIIWTLVLSLFSIKYHSSIN